MKTSILTKDLRQLSVDESANTCGGTVQPDLIFFPVAIGNKLGTWAAPYLVDIYLKTSMFLNF
jgi:hypothetical protein